MAETAFTSIINQRPSPYSRNWPRSARHPWRDQQTLLDPEASLPSSTRLPMPPTAAKSATLIKFRRTISTYRTDARTRPWKADFLSFQRMRFKSQPKPGESEEARAKLEVLTHTSKPGRRRTWVRHPVRLDSSVSSLLGQTQRAFRDAINSIAGSNPSSNRRIRPHPHPGNRGRTSRLLRSNRSRSRRARTPPVAARRTRTIATEIRSGPVEPLEQGTGRNGQHWSHRVPKG